MGFHPILSLPVLLLCGHGSTLHLCMQQPLVVNRPPRNSNVPTRIPNARARGYHRGRALRASREGRVQKGNNIPVAIPTTGLAMERAIDEHTGHRPNLPRG